MFIISFVFVAILFFINLTIFGFTSIISNGYASEKAFYFLSRGRYIKTSRMVYSVMIACFVGLSFDKIMPIETRVIVYSRD